MEALYSINRPQFHQLVTHISLYHDDCSTGYANLVRDCLSRVGIRSTQSMHLWNVPNMTTLLGKSVPLDVHGKHVVIDEATVMEHCKCHGVLRYGLLAAAARQQGGGRFRYDLMTMNVALAAGVASGAGFLAYGRRRWGWMRRRPIGTGVAHPEI